MKTVFISRDLPTKSAFTQILQAAGCKVIGQSMLRFRAVDFDPPALADWLFFYTSDGVDFFLEKIPHIPQNYQLAAMDLTTANRLREYDLEPQFIGRGAPPLIAEAFKTHARGTRVIFVQARKAKKDIEQALAADLDLSALIVYENLPRADLDLPPCDIYVFTSPLNVKSYFDRYLFPNGKAVVSNGPTTTDSLRRYGFSEILESDGPEDTQLAQAVLQLIK
jgi:uroporphyrinogen-III synthase